MNRKLSSIIFLVFLSGISLFRQTLAFGADSLEWTDLRQNFLHPPMDCRPHTYWFWPGNAVTKEEISWELKQMHEQGMGGVLINSAFSPIYEKGALPYLSEAHLEMLRHAVLQAKELGMEVNLNFSGGWVLGGFWVSPEDRSQSLVPAMVELQGPKLFSEALPLFKNASDRRGEINVKDIPDINKLVAVVACKVVEGKIDPSTLVKLTANVDNRSLTWQVPAGQWKLMVFWLKYTGQRTVAPDFGQDHWSVDHLSRTAMQHYCNYLGGQFYKTFGNEFGKTIEAVHSDSFELASLPNGFYWSDSLMVEFKKRKGYDLARYLPCLWWESAGLSPKIKYDVNEFLHQMGVEIYFKTFLDWCRAHNVKGSMEPYGFTVDNIQGAGLADLPFMEITPGEKDAVPWFDNRIGPAKYVASGAHLYGRKVIGVEAYTYLHWEIFRATLEELKIASDGFLRFGATKFYNHLYQYTPEREPAPSRSLPWEAAINHTNTLWKHYRLLADYIARSSYLLRQGDFVADVAVYSPLANQWTLNVMNARNWTRDFYWGDLGKLLVANGYDFDLVNDQALQKFAKIKDGEISINKTTYKILILPNIEALPLETLEIIRDFAQQGGVVIALEKVPNFSVGFQNWEDKDTKVQKIVRDMFCGPLGYEDNSPRLYGAGHTYYFKTVINRQDILDWRSSVLDPFINTLRRHVPPDFGIDFVAAGIRENNGLTFLHRKLQDSDIYFVTNIQDRPCDLPITFRVDGKIPWHWNPYNGTISRLYQYCKTAHGIEIPVRLAPYQSMFMVFKQGAEKVHVLASNCQSVTQLSENSVSAIVANNGTHYLTLEKDGIKTEKSFFVNDVPSPIFIEGNWKMRLPGNEKIVEQILDHLYSWTVDSLTCYFSGTGRYEIDFNLPYDFRKGAFHSEMDLGQVGNIAEVILNGSHVGTIWMRGEKVNITNALKKGSNHLIVMVTNTPVNRISGMKQPSPVPLSLLPHYGAGTSPWSAVFRGSMGFTPLPASGLMGPVRIIISKILTISLNEKNSVNSSSGKAINGNK